MRQWMAVVAVVCLLGCWNTSRAEEPAAPAAAAQRAQASIDKGLTYLKSQQKPDGGWQGERQPPAFTALVLRAFVSDPRYSRRDEFVRRGYEKLLSYQLDSGGIYRDVLANYNTAIAVSAMAAANDPALAERIDRAVVYLKGLQWTDTIHGGPGGEGSIDPKNPWYGGWGYGGQSRGKGRPDLSNVQLTLEALHDAGLKADDPAYQRAVQFVTRLQNNSETNDQAWAGNDGGFAYGPSDDGRGESHAGEYTGPDGRRMLRSYGSMTYAGLKSMIYAGLTKDDPRVRAAWDWIRRNWTLEENPGMRAKDPEMAQYGLYYYYYTFARALGTYGEPVIVDPQGVAHDWRVELVDKLAALQRPDGSWTGEKKWMEDDPVLVTAYAVAALQEAKTSLAAQPAR